jgi:hypothetical protein
LHSMPSSSKCSLPFRVSDQNVVCISLSHACYTPKPISSSLIWLGVGIAQWYNCGLRAGWSEVRDPAGAGNFSLHHRLQVGFGAHPASYPTGTRSTFLGGKEAGVWSLPLSSIYCRGQECVELYLHSHNTPSWRGAPLKYRHNFVFTFIFT